MKKGKKEEKKEWKERLRYWTNTGKGWKERRRKGSKWEKEKKKVKRTKDRIKNMNRGKNK